MSQAKQAKKKQVRVSQTDVPAFSLKDALRISEAIYENYAGDPTTPLNVASAMGLSPASSQFRQLTGASIAFGLTDGGYNAATISITDLAKKINAPTLEGQDDEAKRSAFLRPRVFDEFLRKYDGHAIPKEPIAENVLAEMGVPKDRTARVKAMILEGAKELGLLSEIKGKVYVNLSGISQSSPTVSEVVDVEQDNGDDTVPEATSAKEKFEKEPQVTTVVALPADRDVESVFITHGKNKEFVDPIRKLLAFGGMKAVVSVEKQSVSKPVPDKVMDDMRQCQAAIIHVDGEQVMLDKDASEHVVLNPNVLIEIGAALALYRRRFILLVRNGVELPSNLQGLYEVRYSGETMDSDATIRLLEAINELKKQS